MSLAEVKLGLREHSPAMLMLASGCNAAQASVLSVIPYLLTHGLLFFNGSVSEWELTFPCVCRANPCILQNLSDSILPAACDSWIVQLGRTLLLPAAISVLQSTQLKTVTACSASASHQRCALAALSE